MVKKSPIGLISCWNMLIDSLQGPLKNGLAEVIGASHPLTGYPMGLQTFFFSFRWRIWHSQRPNTMKETLYWPGTCGILGKRFLQVVFSTSVNCFQCGNFLLSYGWGFLSKNSSKMHSWSVIMSAFWPTGMPHGDAQQPTLVWRLVLILHRLMMSYRIWSPLTPLVKIPSQMPE